MMDNKKSVFFDLRRIQTTQYSINEDYSLIKDSIVLDTNLRFAANKEKRMIAVFTKFMFKQNQNPFIQIELMCEFEIKEDSWDDLLDKETLLIRLPQDVAAHLTMLTIGSTRGALHARTEGTDFNRFMIPLIDVNKMFDKDIEIE